MDEPPFWAGDAPGRDAFGRSHLRLLLRKPYRPFPAASLSGGRHLGDSIRVIKKFLESF